MLGRLLAVSERLRTLIGVGTGICGASAIAAVSGIVRATETEIAYAISTIFVFNLVAVLVFPPIGRLLHLSQHGFGLWAGTAVNDTSSVVAAAYAFGHEAGAQAVVVKLTRTTLIIPIALGLSLLQARKGGVRTGRLVPLFLIGFVLASALNTAGLIGNGAHRPLSDAALALITVALAGVGLSSDLGRMRRTGIRPLALGALLWVSVAVGEPAGCRRRRGRCERDPAPRAARGMGGLPVRRRRDVRGHVLDAGDPAGARRASSTSARPRPA